MKNKCGWLLLILILLNACSSAPAKIEYYALHFDQLNPPQKSADQTHELVIVEPVILAGFLRQQGLVVQTSDNQLHMSSQHRWAEQLDQALSRTIVGHLENNLPNYRFENQNGRWSEQPQYRINLSFSHFHTNANNEAVVAGDFWILTNDNTLVRKERFYLAQPLARDGYSHAVDVLNRLLAKFVEEMAAKVPANS